jgi:hypothetical protein
MSIFEYASIFSNVILFFLAGKRNYPVFRNWTSVNQQHFANMRKLSWNMDLLWY